MNQNLYLLFQKKKIVVTFNSKNTFRIFSYLKKPLLYSAQPTCSNHNRFLLFYFIINYHSQPSSLILLLIEVHREDIPEEKTNVFIKSPQSKDFQRSQVM